MSAGIVAGLIGLATAVLGLVPRPDLRRWRARLRRRLVRAEDCAENHPHPPRQQRCATRAEELRAALNDDEESDP